MKKPINQLIFLFLLLQFQLIFAADTVPYEWNSLPIGGHGFITGIVFHPMEKDLIYLRTDVGGAYRWDKVNKTWIQLCDGFGIEEQSFYGIDGLAVDPQNPDVVYMAAGNYTWATGDVLKSVDRGTTWKRTRLNRRFQANGGKRSMGECIAVDPANSSIIYCGTPKEGLWRSEDGALTWQQVTGIEVISDENHQVRNIVFDKNTASQGKTQTIYAGVTNKGIYRSQNGGTSWTLLPGAPTFAKRMEVSPGGILYVASQTGLFKFTEEKWTEISASAMIGKPHNGIAVDPTNENNLVCIGYSTNLMRLPIMRSTDGGKSWVNKLSTAQNTQTIPWIKSQNNTDFSANTADIKLDPFNPNKAIICDFFAPYITEDISAEPSLWAAPLQGIEEVVGRDVISQPVGKFCVITGIADIDGLPYEDITQYPARLIRMKRQTNWEPWMMSTSQIDFCEEDPNILLRVGIDWNANGKAEFSLNNAEGWTNITTVRYYVDASGSKTKDIPFGRAAVSATKHPSTGKPAFVVIPAYNIKTEQALPAGQKTLPLVSLDLGATWQEAKGFPEGTNILNDFWNMQAPIASDRVNGSKFYICASDYVYVSEDWGMNWTRTFKIGGDVNQTIIHAAPYLEGEVWVSRGTTGIFRSTDSGKTFNKIPLVDRCIAFGFGKEAPGLTNPTLYLFGTVEGTTGMFRSTDMGVSWAKINDNQHKFGSGVTCIVGDRRTYGRVYFGTGGRGFYVGSVASETKALKDKNGNVMRGTSMILGKTLSESVAFAQDIENWKTIRNNGYNTIRVCWVDPWYQNHSQDGWTVAQLLPSLDKCVENATATGMNIIINYNNAGAQQEVDQTYLFTPEKEFWTTVAPRYKDNDQVYYELTNEPTFTLSDYLKPDFKAAYLSLYNTVRGLAPGRQVLMFSFNTIAPGIADVVENYKDQLDWTHTTVAYHMYRSTTSDAVKKLLYSYPVICTEWNYHFLSGQPGFEHIQQVDGFRENAQALELLGSGWIDARNWKDITTDELVDTLIADAREKQYWWGSPVTGLKTTGISISKNTMELVSGKSGLLTAFVYPALAENQQVTWTSSDANVAAVDANGLVTATSSRKSSAVITARTIDGFTASCELSVLPSSSKTAYPDGIPHKIPGSIIATYFDKGGEGVGYHDLTPLNGGDGIRKEEGVDTGFMLAEGNIGAINTKEWLEYTVDVQQDGKYTFSILFATAGRYGKFHIEFDGVDKTGTVAVASTSSYSNFAERKITGIQLQKGVQVMRICFDYAEYNMGTISVTHEITAGLVNTGDENRLEVFPTPASDQLSVTGVKTGTGYSIVNMYGQVLQRGIMDETKTIDVRSLHEGSYLLSFKSNNNVSTRKFIKGVR